MPDLKVNIGAESVRRSSATALESLGHTSDERIPYAGAADTPRGRALGAPVIPRDGVDVRKVFGTARFGEATDYTPPGGSAESTWGFRLPALTSPGTDPLASGVIKAYELRDGGEVVIRATGTFKCGSKRPRIMARLKAAGSYIDPQMEVDDTALGGFDIGAALGGFEWSHTTLGINSLWGYEALSVPRTNTPEGLFEWELEMRIQALGNGAARSDYDEDTTTLDSNTRVSAKLTWGGLHYNAGGRIGEVEGWFNPGTGTRSMALNAFLETGTTKGEVYSFGGRQWLCIHGSAATQSIFTGSAGSRTFQATAWQHWMAEEAPGIGIHWRDFWVPMVQESTMTAYATLDYEADIPLVFEMGGAGQNDRGATYSAYASGTHLAESGIVTDSGTNYLCRRSMATGSTYPTVIAGTESGLTAGPTDATHGPRFWVPLPAEEADTMTCDGAHAYLFGGRRGSAQMRLI